MHVLYLYLDVTEAPSEAKLYYLTIHHLMKYIIGDFVLSLELCLLGKI